MVKLPNENITFLKFNAIVLGGFGTPSGKYGQVPASLNGAANIPAIESATWVSSGINVNPKFNGPVDIIFPSDSCVNPLMIRSAIVSETNAMKSTKTMNNDCKKFPNWQLNASSLTGFIGGIISGSTNGQLGKSYCLRQFPNWIAVALSAW